LGLKPILADPQAFLLSGNGVCVAIFSGVLTLKRNPLPKNFLTLKILKLSRLGPFVRQCPTKRGQMQKYPKKVNWWMEICRA
jgi:hypothetical protein